MADEVRSEQERKMCFFCVAAKGAVKIQSPDLSSKKKKLCGGSVDKKSNKKCSCALRI